MHQVNPPPSDVKESIVIGSIKLQEIPYVVKSPIFEDVVIERPVFKDRQIEIPSGWDKVINALALEISDKVIKYTLHQLDEKLAAAIDSRVSEIKYPKLIEEVKVTEIPITVEKPVYKDVSIDRPVYVDKEIINPVPKDVEVINAVIIDKPVINAVIDDIRVTNAIIKDVEVERAVIREKVIDVIHPRYLKLNGEPE